MSFRTRLFLGILLGALIPLGALVYGVRGEMDRRLTAEYEGRVESMAQVIETDLAQARTTINARLRALVTDLARDNRFRLAVQGNPSYRQYLLNYAGGAMTFSGMSMLQVQDDSGKILSSGHFRNEFDRLQPELPGFVLTTPSMVLVRTRTAEAPMIALVRGDSLQITGRRYTIVGGIGAQTQLVHHLSSRGDLSVALVFPDAPRPTTPGSRVIREISLPYLDLLGKATGGDSASIVITQSLGSLEALRRSVDRWFFVAVAITGTVALILATWLSAYISGPLRVLTRKTAEIDLERLDHDFESGRRDEIGTLSRVLSAMMDRLRTSSARLREVERRAAMGELAQQVNHDIKNGLAPIRNVLRHFSQVASQEPGLLASVYEERKATLQSSVEYLETLARNYARLSPGIDRTPCDVNALVEEVLRHTSADGTALHTDLNREIPPALGDSLLIRRILENLVGNAVDSLAGRPGGRVTVTTGVSGGEGKAPKVRIRVSDTGQGMNRRELERAFDDFYTTKAHGTGLGLSIVRRLVLDLNGSLQVETEPGAGTTFVVELPAAPEGRAA